MTRKSLVLALALMAVAALSALALASGYPGDPLPAGATDPGTVAWELDNEQWVPAQFAFTWNSTSASSNGKSNKEVHTFDIVNHVSVAQWVDYSISGTRKDWRIMRPGTYASDSVSATIASNNDVRIEFWATDPTYYYEGNQNEGESVTPTIPKWFSYSESNDVNQADANGWIRGSDYNEQSPFVINMSDSANLHAGMTFKIWEKIEVVESNSSSDYEGTGTVRILLTNMKHWVDAETGGWFHPSGYGSLDENHLP